MMIQVKRCPHCRRIYDSGQYREKIGKPLKTCPFCRSLFIDTNTNEWTLLSIGGKISYIFYVLIAIFTTGILAGMVVLLLLILPDILFKTNISHFVISSGNGVIALGVVCWILTAVYILIREVRDISASNARMKDAGYLQILETAGLLKK